MTDTDESLSFHRFCPFPPNASNETNETLLNFLFEVCISYNESTKLEQPINNETGNKFLELVSINNLFEKLKHWNDQFCESKHKLRMSHESRHADTFFKN